MRTPCDTSALRPPLAEAARTAVATATTPVLLTDPAGPDDCVQAWHALANGDILISVSDNGIVATVEAAGDLPARLDLLDAAAVPMRDRYRGQVSFSGWLSFPVAGDPSRGPGPRGCRQLQLEVAEIQLDGVEVDLEEYAAAVPDPLGARESAALQRLARQHPDGLAWLLPPALAATALRVAPLRLHRRALVLRVERADGETDVSIALPRGRRDPLPRTAVEILAALDRLVGDCPRAVVRPARPGRQSEGGAG